jgi:hypothetical protein
VTRTAFEVVKIILPQREDFRGRHALELLLGVEALGVVEAVLLVLCQVVVGAQLQEHTTTALAGSYRDLTPNFEIAYRKVPP